MEQVMIMELLLELMSERVAILAAAVAAVPELAALLELEGQAVEEMVK